MTCVKALGLNCSIFFLFLRIHIKKVEMLCSVSRSFLLAAMSIAQILDFKHPTLQLTFLGVRKANDGVSHSLGLEPFL